ncbi:MAG: nitrilase [Candidatus Aminicenantes bacterium]|nr:nitrilase [Candidatus Aminicenantes bacterium]
MRIVLAQISPYLGDVEKNFRLHLKYIEKAKKKNADLIIFPELSLTGYTLKDLVENVALNHEKDRFFGQLKTLSKEISIVLGFVEEKERGLFYNSGAFLSRGKILHVHRKVFLPTYGMFEEGKYFGQGKNFNTFTTPYGNTGMMICYDFLHYSASYCLFAGGTEIIIVISAAPGRGISDKEFYTTSHMWELMGKTISRFSSAFLVYCNRTGFEDGKSFAGGSFIYNPAGELIAKASYVDEDFLIKEINLDEIRTIRKKWPYKRDDKPEIILEVLKRIVRKYED